MQNPSSYSKPESIDFKPKAVWFPAIVRYGNSPMHAKPRSMEAFNKASRKRRVAVEQKRKKTKYTKAYRKLRLKEMKLADQAAFYRDCDGMLVDQPDAKVGMMQCLLVVGVHFRFDLP